MEGRVITAFNDQLWQEYRSALYRFILNRINEPSLAEDIVQEVLTKAYHQLDTLKDNEKILAWLYQITRNAIIDHYRKHKQPLEELTETLSIQESDLAEAVDRELAQCLMPLVKQLPLPYQQAVMWAEMDGLTQKEVAQKQGITLPGAKSRVQRGRKMLKELLLKCCSVELDQRGSIINYQPKKKCDGYC